MTQVMVLEIMNKAFLTIMIMSGPILLIAMIVGLIISILQATTQIQEQTLSFVPKIVAVILGLMIFGNFMINKILVFTTDMFKMISLIG